MGPVSILRGKNADKYIEFSSSVTLRYSDAPREEKSYVTINKDKKKDEIISEPTTEESYIKFRI
jgi:hypothetical protein